jgi:protein-glutamine gamma-glutamyltransferase
VNPQRTLGFLLVMLQAAALGYGFQTWAYSAAVLAVGMIGWLSRIRLASPPATRRWPWVLAVLYLVQRTLVPRDWYSGTPSFLFPDACLTAQYLLVFQVGQFFIHRERDRLPSYLPVLAMVALTLTADVQVRGAARTVYLVFSLALAVLSALYFAACRLPDEASTSRTSMRRNVMLSMVLLLTAATGGLAASGLYAYAREIERVLILMARSSPPESAGFSGQGRLGSVAHQKERSGTEVALRIWSEEPPGYLRGRAFDTYARSAWHSSGGRFRLSPEPEQGLPSGLRNRRAASTFVLSPSDSEAWTPMEIWPNRPFREAVFVPARLTALQAPFEPVTIDVHGILETQDLPVGLAYIAWSSIQAEDGDVPLEASDRQPLDSGSALALAPDAKAWQLLTELPADLDPRVRELALRVAGGDMTDGEKIAAVQRYFLANYQYQVGIDVPAGADPLTHFLLQKPAAHCEYFASGAAVLLRAVGVPCRYVTGFVAVEPNRHGGYWMARNRDAHAWVEAYDRDRGWVLVEATPAAGVPQSDSSGTTDQRWDAWRARWQRAVAAIRQGGLRVILVAVGRWLQSPGLWIVLLLLATAWALRRLVHRLRQASAVPIDPRLEQLRRLLRRMDQRWRRAGIVRAPCETPHQFADRLLSISTAADHQQAAKWYRQYATVRYSGPVDPQAIDQLRDQMAG